MEVEFIVHQILASSHGKIKTDMKDEESLVTLGSHHCSQSFVGINMTWEPGAYLEIVEKGEERT